MSDQATSVVAVAGIVIGAASLAWQVLSHQASKKPVTLLNITSSVLKATENGLDVKIVCTIVNSGRRRMELEKAFLLVDEGHFVGEELQFPELFVRESRHLDCRLSEWCRQHSGKYPPYAHADTFAVAFPLPFLTDTVSFIGAKEKFKIEKVIKVQRAGYYRATCVVIRKDKDCVCQSEIIRADAEAREQVAATGLD